MQNQLVLEKTESMWLGHNLFMLPLVFIYAYHQPWLTYTYTIMLPLELTGGLGGASPQCGVGYASLKPTYNEV